MPTTATKSPCACKTAATARCTATRCRNGAKAMRCASSTATSAPTADLPSRRAMPPSMAAFFCPRPTRSRRRLCDPANGSKPARHRQSKHAATQAEHQARHGGVMHRNLIWGCLVLAGMLITRLGFSAVNASEVTLPDMLVTLLLAGVAGVAGLLGALNWLLPLPRD